MGIFGKKPGTFEPAAQQEQRLVVPNVAQELTLPSPPAAVERVEPALPVQPVASSESGGNSPMSYSIEDVIRLMRELPDSKKEMVVVIVQKTLLSAKIDIHSIIEDAGRKLDRLQRQNEKLVSEIRELEESIIQKKAEVDHLMRDIDETNSVKSIFESVYGRHVKQEGEAAPEKEKTVPPAAPAIKIF